MLRILFNAFRLATTEAKRKRLNQLRKYMKAWRESRSYKKFIMASNLTALKFK